MILLPVVMFALAVRSGREGVAREAHVQVRQLPGDDLPRGGQAVGCPARFRLWSGHVGAVEVCKECDVAFPSATQNEINGEEAKALSAAACLCCTRLSGAARA